MEYFMLTLTGGIAIGCTYGLIGLAFTAIFNASRVINFASGDIAIAGAFAASLFVFSGDLPLILGLFGVLFFSVLCGLLVNEMAEPSVRKQAPVINTILITLSGGLIVEGVIGAYTHFSYFQTKMIFGFRPITFGSFSIAPQYGAIILITAVLTFSYWWMLNKTYLGMGIKALGINADMSALLGINTRRTRALTWAISSSIAGISGFLIAPLTAPTALMGGELVVNGFIAAVIGGFGHPLAAVSGGIALGLLIQFFSAYVSAGYAQLVMLCTLMLVLAFRPTGIWGLEIQ